MYLKNFKLLKPQVNKVLKSLVDKDDGLTKIPGIF